MKLKRFRTQNYPVCIIIKYNAMGDKHSPNLSNGSRSMNSTNIFKMINAEINTTQVGACNKDFTKLHRNSFVEQGIPGPGGTGSCWRLWLYNICAS